MGNRRFVMDKPKPCCNSKCNNVFFVSKERFFQKDLCDECVEKRNP